MLFGTQGPTAGAIVVEWNIAEDSQGSAGMWDSHIRYVSNSFTRHYELTEIALQDLVVRLVPTSSPTSAKMELFLMTVLLLFWLCI